MVSSHGMSPAPRAFRGGALAGALVGLAGCHTFHPVVPLRGADGDATFSTTSLRVWGMLRDEAVVTVEVVRGDFRRLAEARVAPLSARECQGGLAARSVALRGPSGQELPTRTLGEDVRSIDLAFSREELGAVLEGNEPAFADLQLAPDDRGGKRSCTRVPLLGSPGTVTWAESGGWHLGAGGRVFWLPRSSHGLSWGWLVTGRGGLFVGRLRLGIETGAGRGEQDPTATYQGFYLYGGAVFLETLLASLPGGPGGRIGLDGQLGYDVVAAEGRVALAVGGNPPVYGSSGARWWYHGPRAALRVAFLPAAPEWPGFATRRDASAVGVELYASRWWSSGTSPAWVLGLGITGHLML